MDLREYSRRDFSRDDPTYGDLKLGCLLRLADAIEKMSRSYQSLIDDRDLYKRWWKNEQAENERLSRQVSALRGVITKMKNAEKEKE